jgi:hypothetical protein
MTIFIVYIWKTYYFVAIYIGDVAKKQGVIGVQAIGVPMSIGYTAHRGGEWTMLLLGETFLSLTTIVDVHRFKELVLFSIGMGTIFIFFYSFFMTYPEEANKHVARRSRIGGVKFAIMMGYLLPLALVTSAIGAKSLIYLYGKQVYYENFYDPAKFKLYYAVKPARQMYCYAAAAFFLLVTMMSILHIKGFTAYFVDLAKCVHLSATRDEGIQVAHFLLKFVCLVLFIIVPSFAPDSFQTMLAVFVISLVFAVGTVIENPDSLSKVHEDHGHSPHPHAPTSNLAKTEQRHAAHVAKAAAGTTNAIHGKTAAGSTASPDASDFEMGDVLKGK